MPLVGRNRKEILGGRPAGIGYAYVDAPKPLCHLLGKALDCVGVSDVQSFGINLGSLLLRV